MSRLHLGIRSQLLTITVVPFLLLTLLLIIVIYRSHVLQTQAALVRQGNLLAAQLAANLEYALSTGALEQIPHAIEATVQPALTLMEIPVTAVTVRDHQQQVLVSQSLPQRTSPSLLERQIVRFLTLDDLRFTANVYLNPLEIVSDQQKSRRLLGEVELHLSIIPLRAEQLSRLLSDLGLLFLAVLLASALALGVGQRLVSAIRTAAQAIRRIEAGDLSARVQKTDHTEIGTLQNGINMLAETVGQAQTRLEHELAKVRAEYEQTLQALQVQTQRAADASQAKSRFLASVSHDLRTPLYTIQALAEQLVRSKQPAPQDSRQILAATQTLLTIINEILDFAQLEEGRYQTSCEPFDPWSELEIMTDALEWRCREQQLYLDLVVADNPGTVRGDVKAFRAIAHNLISNAIHYTTQGGVTITLSTLKQEENQDKDGIRLTVADTGCGIPQSRQQDIFRPFEQLNGSLGRHHTGRGLGLSIVQHFCELIGATITLDSTEGQGTVFTVELPLQRYIDESAAYHLNADCTVLVVDRRAGFCDSLRSR
ncbi:MAG: HAMP domain-containing protein, partial [Candidatus Competibacteraceae bacterium]|nr:HAMP domain-containing protein [Candidatus Competibacteraceae bacterium]